MGKQSQEAAAGDRTLIPGQSVYDESGEAIGVIRALTEYGAEVRTHDTVDPMPLEVIPANNFGQGYLMWRCANCGELGEIESLPDACPACGAPKEDLYAFLED